MAKKNAGTEKAKNSVVLGLLAGWLGRRPRVARSPGIRKKFAQEGRRGPAGQRERLRRRRAVRGGAPAARAAHARRRPSAMVEGKLVVDGNDMCAAAAIFAGCEFFGGYPITPSSEIMQFFGREVWKYGGAMIQCEDEIAGIGAVRRRVLRRQEGHDRDLGPGHVAQDRDAGPRLDRRAAARVRERAARRALHRPADEERAGGPLPGLLLRPRRRRAAGAGADLGGRHLRDHGRGLQRRRALPDAGRSCSPTRRSRSARRRSTRSTRRPSRSWSAGGRPRRELEKYERFKATDSGISPISHPGMPGGQLPGLGDRAQRARAPRPRAARSTRA